MLEAITAIGALGFFAVLGAAFWLLFLLFLVADDRPFGAVVVIFAAIGVLWWAGIANVPLYIWNHPGQIALWVVGWAAAGTFWSFFKYDRYCAREAKLRDHRPVLDHQTWRITNWIVFWPFSMVAYVCGDMIKHVCEAIVKQFNKIYEAIADRHFPAVK